MFKKEVLTLTRYPFEGYPAQTSSEDLVPRVMTQGIRRIPPPEYTRFELDGKDTSQKRDVEVEEGMREEEAEDYGVGVEEPSSDGHTIGPMSSLGQQIPPLLPLQFRHSHRQSMERTGGPGTTSMPVSPVPPPKEPPGSNNGARMQQQHAHSLDVLETLTWSINEEEGMTEEKGELTDAELERKLAEYNADAEEVYGDGDAELERFLAEHEIDEDGEIGWLKERSWKGFGEDSMVAKEKVTHTDETDPSGAPPQPDPDDTTTAILQPKKSPNRLVVEEAPKEIDSIAPKAEKPNGGREYRTDLKPLTLMDGLKARSNVAVIADMHRQSDPVPRRVGRFDREVDRGKKCKDTVLSTDNVDAGKIQMNKVARIHEAANVDPNECLEGLKSQRTHTKNMKLSDDMGYDDRGEGHKRTDSTSLKSSKRPLESASSPLLALNSRKRTDPSAQRYSHSEYAKETLTNTEKERDSVKSQTSMSRERKPAGHRYDSSTVKSVLLPLEPTTIALPTTPTGPPHDRKRMAQIRELVEHPDKFIKYGMLPSKEERCARDPEVTETNPAEYCIVAQDTVSTSVKPKEEETHLNDVGYDDIGGCRNPRARCTGAGPCTDGIGKYTGKY